MQKAHIIIVACGPPLLLAAGRSDGRYGGVGAAD
eukprot:SAG25_NODE_13920_length_261_cov_0.641975_1_plen_33_part_01